MRKRTFILICKTLLVKYGQFSVFQSKGQKFSNCIFILKTEIIRHQTSKIEVNFTRSPTRKLSQQSLNNKKIKIYIIFFWKEANHYSLISSNRHSAMSFVMLQLQIPRKIVMQLNFNFFLFISSSVPTSSFIAYHAIVP